MTPAEPSPAFPPSPRGRRRLDQRGNAELLAALADWDVALFRRAMLGETGEGNRGLELLRAAVEIAEDEEP